MTHLYSNGLNASSPKLCYVSKHENKVNFNGIVFKKREKKEHPSCLSIDLEISVQYRICKSKKKSNS